MKGSGKGRGWSFGGLGWSKVKWRCAKETNEMSIKGSMDSFKSVLSIRTDGYPFWCEKGYLE